MQSIRNMRRGGAMSTFRKMPAAVTLDLLRRIVDLFYPNSKIQHLTPAGMENRASLPDSQYPAIARSTRRDWFELVFVYFLILLVIWTPRPWQPFMWAIAAVLTLTIAALSFQGLQSIGITKVNLLASLWAVGVALAVAIVAVVLAFRLHTLHVPPGPILFIKHYIGYVLWAAIQQLVLQCFFLSRSLRLFPDPKSAVALASAMFAIAHLPNPILTFICWVCGLASCLFFLRYRNLVPIAAAHAILGISIAITIPGPVDHNMRVGLGYLTYVDKSALVEVGKSPLVTKTVVSSKP